MTKSYYAKSDSPITPVSGGEAPPPLIIWGPGDPRPTLPIAGWDPGSGTFPEPSPEPLPPQIWGPTDPRPTVPIAEPPWGWGGTPPPMPEAPKLKPVIFWTSETGWQKVYVPTGPTVTPSRR